MQTLQFRQSLSRRSWRQPDLAEAYYDGDLDTLFSNWMGPQLSTEAPNYEKVRDELQRMFVPLNKVAEVVDRHRRALISKKSRFSALRGSSEDESLTAQLAEWISKAKLEFGAEGQDRRIAPKKIELMADPLQQAVTWSLLRCRGYLRLCHLPEEQTPADATEIDTLLLHAPKPDEVQVIARNGKVVQIQTQVVLTDLESDSDRNMTEVQQVASNGQTLIAYVDSVLSDSIIEIDESDPGLLRLDLGGRFTVVEISCGQLFTSTVQKLQDSICYLLSLFLRNQTTAGFAEVLISNALPPGEWQPAGSVDLPVGGGELTDRNMRYVPRPEDFERGPGNVTFLQGVPIFDEMGGIKGYTNPGIQERAPSTVANFTEGINMVSALLYQAVGQSFLTVNESSTLSGISRQESRRDFQISIEEDASNISSSLERLFEVVLLMLNPGAGDLTTSVQLRPTVFPPSPEERTQILAAYEKGLISKRTAVAALAYVDNIEAELATLEEEADGNPSPE